MDSYIDGQVGRGTAYVRFERGHGSVYGTSAFLARAAVAEVGPRWRFASFDADLDGAAEARARPL